ncbi:GNAT family N-acetyltransferase [Clostridium saccharoperbutylacetonicum]|uniref:GNAT family N-acetyltransferase n=1 Tax=Clostridium saccharoperbutylacetonicum TaxID=36745 RepID=UPI00156D94E7|nr:GNAT family N-acetyltransferase [Clostridium saccharoperbutylacetonicum]NSB30226.1 phosphinothricin acetyltransferase [Clostridium saccharoperbutylacetonicum]
MNYTIEKMKKSDWDEVSQIYLEGINTGIATFQNSVPTFEAWDNGHIEACRLVAKSNEKVLGFITLSATSSRCVYSGVAEVSIYVGKNYRGLGIGHALMTNMIKLSEENNFWTLQSGIIKENVASIKLHESCGFREIGIREKIAKMDNGIWHDTVLMEHRSKVIGID